MLLSLSSRFYVHKIVNASSQIALVSGLVKVLSLKDKATKCIPIKCYDYAGDQIT